MTPGLRASVLRVTRAASNALVPRGTTGAARLGSMRLLTCAAAIAAFLIIGSTAPGAQSASPSVELIPAPLVRLPGETDSNSPIVWDRVGGRDVLFAITSSSGLPRTAFGPRLDRLGEPRDIRIDPWPGGGIWMEAVIADVDGTWYGYYHNENVAAAECGETVKVIPRIGAARSRDHGRTWQPLGVVLEAPPGSYRCQTTNHYFVGGVGDFSVQLDPESRDVYFFFSQYHRARVRQGVGIARLAWADRDNPTGKIMVWAGRPWLPASSHVSGEDELAWRYPSAVPIFPTLDSWHDNDTEVDAFWGPSVHWNTHLQQYVMLLNRATDHVWAQEGIYVSYAPRLDDPQLWSRPVKIVDGGLWYPQVIGLMPGAGTDKTAGAVARLFIGGQSSHFIRFVR